MFYGRLDEVTYATKFR